MKEKLLIDFLQSYINNSRITDYMIKKYLSNIDSINYIKNSIKYYDTSVFSKLKFKDNKKNIISLLKNVNKDINKIKKKIGGALKIRENIDDTINFLNEYIKLSKTNNNCDKIPKIEDIIKKYNIKNNLKYIKNFYLEKSSLQDDNIKIDNNICNILDETIIKNIKISINENKIDDKNHSENIIKLVKLVIDKLEQEQLQVISESSDILSMTSKQTPLLRKQKVIKNIIYTPQNLDNKNEKELLESLQIIFNYMNENFNDKKYLIIFKKMKKIIDIMYNNNEDSKVWNKLQNITNSSNDSELNKIIELRKKIEKKIVEIQQ